MEPAGALAVAGLKALGRRASGRRGQRLVAILSGANMNFDRLRFVAERAELGEAREALLAVTIPERPGAFREFCAALGPRVVTEFNYRLERPRRRRTSSSASATARGRTPRRSASGLRARGYETLDLSDNEMAKLHVRHMVGGRAPRRRARAALPLRVPRAARRAACSSSTRSAGAGTSACSTTATTAPTSAACWPRSRCPDAELAELHDFLDRLGYPSVSESENPAYALFLAGNGC